jgi:hypothetical protein
VEQCFFGAPVSLLPGGSLNIIANDKWNPLDNEIATVLHEALKPYVDRN